jgi:glycosyltransferase involved in cell wall biosynthesis
MCEPIVSIVIPTANRPRHLPRAIDSALAGMHFNEVEVIVIPNGPDKSWKKSLSKYASHPSVKVFPISIAHANVARNHGMSLAAGKYIRFLDDDDFLYPEGARKQYELLEQSDGDVCSGAFDMLSHRKEILSTIKQMKTDDLVEGVLGRRGMWQPTPHVFRRSALDGLHWDETLSFCQDFDWMLRLSLKAGVVWVSCDWVVGAWCRHLESRISLRYQTEGKARLMAEKVLSAVSALELQGSANQRRRDAAAVCLWNCVHDALCFSPLYWTKVARKAQALSPESRPRIPLYTNPLMLKFLPNPLIWEWVMVPKRYATYKLNRILKVCGLAKHG